MPGLSSEDEIKAIAVNGPPLICALWFIRAKKLIKLILLLLSHCLMRTISTNSSTGVFYDGSNAVTFILFQFLANG